MTSSRHNIRKGYLTLIFFLVFTARYPVNNFQQSLQNGTFFTHSYLLEAGKRYRDQSLRCCPVLGSFSVFGFEYRKYIKDGDLFRITNCILVTYSDFNMKAAYHTCTRLLNIWLIFIHTNWTRNSLGKFYSDIDQTLTWCFNQLRIASPYQMHGPIK